MSDEDRTQLLAVLRDEEGKQVIYVAKEMTEDPVIWEWAQDEIKRVCGEDALDRVRIVEPKETVRVLSASRINALMAAMCTLDGHSWNKTRKTRWRCQVCNKVRKVRKRRRKKEVV